MDTEFQREHAHIYRLTGRLLLGGLLVSIAVMVLGLILAAIQGNSPRRVLPLDRLPGHLVAGEAGAFLDLGILLLFATPLAGVISALVAFAVARDRLMTRATTVLLLLLVIAFAVALKQ